MLTRFVYNPDGLFVEVFLSMSIPQVGIRKNLARPQRPMICVQQILSEQLDFRLTQIVKLDLFRTQYNHAEFLLDPNCQARFFWNQNNHAGLSLYI